jgi:hypothetical protein
MQTLLNLVDGCDTIEKNGRRLINMKTAKKVIPIVLTMMFAFVLVGCGSEESTPVAVEHPNEMQDAHEIVEEDTEIVADEEIAVEEIIYTVSLSEIKEQIDFLSLTLFASEDVRHSTSDTHLWLYFSDESFPMGMLMSEGTANRALTTNDVDSFLTNVGNQFQYEGAQVSWSEIERINISGLAVYLAQTNFDGDIFNVDDVLRSTAGIFVANNNIYTIMFVASPFLHDLYLPYFRAILNTIEVIVPTQMLYNSELRTQLIAFVSGLDFIGIIEMFDQYLEDVQADDGDIAHEVRELAIRANEILNNMYIHVDDFDGQITVYYPGVRAITQSINKVPYIRPARATSTGANATLFLRMGFQRNNWLFFDRTSLRLSDDSFIHHNNTFFDRQTEILRGGIQEEVVRDWGLVNWNSGYIRRRINYMDVDYNHVLRFTNRDDDTHHDVTLSNVEINAVRNILELFQLMGRLGHEIPRQFR